MNRTRSYWTAMFAVGLLAFLTTACAHVAMAGVEAPVSGQERPPTDRRLAASAGAREGTAVSRGRPYFGFNAKGSKDTVVQTARADDLLKRITDRSTRRNLVIRVTGGTISQTTSGADWSDAMIGSWVTLQRKHGIRFVFVVNGNDAPADQAALIERWLDAGARFDFIEMMNEYYLPRYAKGDRSHPAVSRVVTPELYVTRLLPAYWRELDRFRLPYYLVFAPTRTATDAAGRTAHWNEVVARAVNVTYRKRDLNATLHLYARGGERLSEYDYGQIDRLRASLPSGRHIAVTEAGIIDPAASTQQLGRLAVTHYRNIVRRLHAGDYVLDQVLFSPAPRNNTATLDRDGVTAKGAAVLEFVRGGMR